MLQGVMAPLFSSHCFCTYLPSSEVIAWLREELDEADVFKDGHIQQNQLVQYCCLRMNVSHVYLRVYIAHFAFLSCAWRKRSFMNLVWNPQTWF